LSRRSPSRFLVTVAILEAVFGSPDGASAAWLHRDRLSGDLGPLRRLSFEPWHGFPEGATFYASDDLLAVSCLNPTPESDEYLSVWVGARDRSALSAPSWTKAGSTTRGASANATALVHGIGLILPYSSVLLGKSVRWVLRHT
jgi:hypothetical protein